MKRFLFIFTLLVSLLLPCTLNVYAADIPNWPEDVPTITESFEYDHIIIFDTGDGSYIAHGSNVSPYYKDGALFYPLPNIVRIIQYLPSNGLWNMNYFNETNYRYSSNASNLFWSNHDIYNEDGTELFFQLPQPVLGMEKEILAQVVTQENPLTEILTLLPMVIPCLVGFVALRKALRTLETILKTS